MNSQFLLPIAPLFVPADRPERFTKAANSEADAIILDLEDAVAPANKNSAREALKTDFTDKPIIIRINGIGTPWHEKDLQALQQFPNAIVMLPKAECLSTIASLAKSMSVIGLIETAKGIGLVTVLCRSPISLCYLGLKREWADAAQIRMSSAGVVEPIDVLKDGGFCLFPCLPILPPDEFCLQGFEEGLNGGVVITITLTTH